MDSDHLISQLNSALKHLYSPQCSNEEKETLYAELNRFQQSGVCLPVCVKLLETSDEIMLMYALHAIQDCTQIRWHKISAEVRTETFDRLAMVLEKRCDQFPKFVTSKLAQILAQICRLNVLNLDSASRTTRIVQAINQYFQNSKYKWLGCLLLRNILDEFSHPQNTPLLNCKHGQLVLKQMEEISANFADQLAGIISAFEFGRDLSCVFSIVSLICEIKPQIILNCDSMMQALCNGCLKKGSPDISLYSLQSLTDLIDQPVPFSQEILINFTSICTKLLSEMRMENSEEHQTKVILFCHNLLHKGVPRMKNQSLVAPLLVALNQFMQFLPSPEIFSECLRCWHVICDRLLATNGVLSAVESLAEPLTGLVNLTQSIVTPKSLNDWQRWREIYNLPEAAIKIRKLENQMEQNAFTDVEDLNDNESFDCMVRSVLELVAKVAMLSPEQVYQIYNRTFDECVGKVLHCLDHSVELIPFDVARTQTSMRAMARLSFLLTIEHDFESRTAVAKNVVEKLCQLLERLEPIANGGNSYIQNMLSMCLLCVRSHCHWIHECYCRAQRSGQHVHSVSAYITCAVDTSTAIICGVQAPSPKGQVPCYVYDTMACVRNREMLLECANALLYSVLLTVRPHSFILAGKSINRLIELVCTQDFYARHHVLTCSIAGYFILPWFNCTDSEQCWNERKPYFNRMVHSFTEKFILNCQLVNKNGNELQRYSTMLLYFLREFMKIVEGEGVKCKKHVATSLWPMAEMTLHCIKEVHSGAVLEPLLDLLKCLIQILSVQFGADYATNSLQILGQIAVPQAGGPLLSCHALLTVLDILNTLCKEISKQFTHLVPELVNIVLLTLKQPCLELPSSTAEVHDRYYCVVHALIASRWRFFFPNMPKDSANENDSNVWTGVPTEIDENGFKILMQQRANLLTDLLRILVESLEREQDCLLHKSNLKRLLDLHTKWNLFEKSLFQSQLAINLLDTLWRLLLSANQSLIHEDVSEMVCILMNSCAKAMHGFSMQYMQNLVANTVKPAQADIICAQYCLQDSISSLTVMNLKRDLTSAVALM